MEFDVDDDEDYGDVDFLGYDAEEDPFGYDYHLESFCAERWPGYDGRFINEFR